MRVEVRFFGLQPSEGCSGRGRLEAGYCCSVLPAQWPLYRTPAIEHSIKPTIGARNELAVRPSKAYPTDNPLLRGA